MPWTAAAIVGGAVIGSMATQDAADTQAGAARDAQASNERMFNKNVELQAPWREAGMGALSQLTAGLGDGGQFTKGFTFSDQDPSYQFRVNQGTRALDAGAAARGGLLSGGALKALVNYGQQAGSQEYQNAYNRWNNDLTNRFNRLASVAGLGQTATRDVTAMGTNLANVNGELGLQAANAGAAGSIGQANAISTGLTSLGNWWQNRQAGQQTGTPATVAPSGGMNWDANTYGGGTTYYG